MRGRQRSTIIDIARAAGVSVSTVSRVIGALARTLNSAFASGILQGAMEVGEESGYGLLLLPAELDPVHPSAGLLHAVTDGLLVVSPGLATNPDPETFGKPIVYVEQHRDAVITE